MRHIAIILFLISFTILVYPQSKTVDQKKPEEVCAIFAEIPGMQTRGYKRQETGEYGCLSFYKEFGEGFPLKNNIAYYTKGTAEEVRELKLVLNVNARQEAFDAHTILWKCAQLLSIKTIGEITPDDVGKWIMEGKSGARNFKGAKVAVVRDDWPTGKGYGMKFTIEFEESAKGIQTPAPTSKPCFENGRKVPCP